MVYQIAHKLKAGDEGLVWLSDRMPGVNVPMVANLVEFESMLVERITELDSRMGTERSGAGRKQGIEKGEQALLRRLLVRRFVALPEWADSQLTGASLAQLEGWGDRLLDTQSLEDVFQ